MKILINGQEVDLSNVVIDIKQAPSVIAPIDPPAPVDPPVVVAPPPASKIIASCQVIVAGTSVTFTDKTISALPITSVLVGPGLGGGNKEIGAAGSVTLTYPAGKFNAAITATDSSGAKSVKLFAITVPGDSDNTYSASDPSTGTAPPAAPPVVSTNPPVVAPAPTGSQDGAAHTVVATVLDAAGVAWYANARVGEDWTVDGVYLSFANADGVAHGGLRGRFYSDCCDIGACPGANALDYAGTLSVTYDGAEVFSATAVQFYRGAMNKTLRYGPQAPWHAVDPTIFPNWAKPTAPLPLIDPTKYDLSYNGLGVASTTGMGDPGSRKDIGFVPGWDVPFCLQPSDASFAVVRAAADNSGVWPIYWIDDNTGYPYDITQYPDTSMLPYTQAVYANNPIANYNAAWKTTGAKVKWSESHQTAYNFVAAAATGTARDKWHAAVHANAVLIAFNATQRQAQGVFAGYEERGTGWALRSIFLGSQVSSMPDYFLGQLEIMRRIAPQTNALGFLADHMRPGANDVAGGPSTGIANWEENYGRLTVGVIANKLPEWADFRAYWSKSLVMQASSVQYPLATVYVLTIKDAAGDFLPDWTAIMQATLRGPQGIPVPPKMTPPNDQGAWAAEDIAAFTDPNVTPATVYALLAKYIPGYVAGDFLSFPASSQGYAAIQSGALAAAVDAGVPGATQAWENWQNVPTKVNWSDDWGFNIVPRAT